MAFFGFGFSSSRASLGRSRKAARRALRAALSDTLATSGSAVSCSRNSRRVLPPTRSVSPFGAERAHQRGHAVARDAVDHHQPDRGLLGLDERLVRIARLPVDHDQIGALARLERAERLVPLEDRRGVPRGHRHQVTRAEQAVQHVLGVEPGDLQLAEQVLAAGGRPVAAQADAHPGPLGRVHARGGPVEQQVAERRPDHRAAVLGEHVEVLGQQARRVDAGEPVVDRPLVRRDLQREEMPARHRVGLARLGHALAQVQEEAAVLLLQPGQERRARPWRPRRRCAPGPRTGPGRRSARRCARCRGRSAGRRRCC